MEYKVRNIGYHDCRVNYPDADHQPFTEWTMTSTGLRCAQEPPVKEEEKKDEE